jgi:hypothetical protein
MDKVKTPNWFMDEKNDYTWEQVLDKAFPKTLYLRNEKNPKPFLEQSCKFPDGVRKAKYKYRRAIVLHDGEEVDLYDRECINEC